MEKILQYIDTFLSHLVKDNPEGVLFYAIGSAVMTWVLIKNKDEFKVGLKGTNNLWEPPEIVLYLWLWMFTQTILAVLFLELTPPDLFWAFMFLCLLFALAGKEGILLLFNWRGVSTSTTIQKETSEKTMISTETEQQEKN
jgi:hypothetical protein